MDSEQTNLGFEQFLVILRRRALWILLCFLVGAAAFFAYAKRETKKYTAVAVVAFNNNPLDEQIAGLSTSSSRDATAERAADLELITSGDTATKTASLLGHGLTGEKISSTVSTKQLGESGTIALAATSTSPSLAAAIVNTYANQFVKEQASTFKSTLAAVNHQLAALSPQERYGADGLALQNRAQTLALLAELGYNNVQVTREAATPTSPSSPRIKRTTGLGAVLGLLFGLGLAWLLDRRDRRIREPDELEGIYGLPMLGVVPDSAALALTAPRDGSRGAGLPTAEAEAFSLIRAHLRFFNIDRDLRTILIASPAPGDGKSTIARHLAEAAARSGSRVLLLEADLRQPTLARQTLHPAWSRPCRRTD